MKPTLIVGFDRGMFKDCHGDRLRSRLTDDEAIRLVDAVVNSIRLRSPSGN
ncbi:hypothetical protein KTD28_19330 [Burkholderia gladioli]|nr:hypothetical protein [Burkholderia gladioli]MBJ9714763.1 hypothetical protein [Burkholderia gladioli]MBU9156759.1 hypothetical protein [Burkholderia gladioli]MBU9166636.1 hypothetical protein [Burkholderia gladioli]MBU9186508.1 hypothetical protein [Burkholderia gladioli]